MNAIITMEDTGDFICADTLMTVSVDMKDQRSDLLIFRCPEGRSGMKTLVIYTLVYSKNFAERFNAVLKSQLVYSA